MVSEFSLAVTTRPVDAKLASVPPITPSGSPFPTAFPFQPFASRSTSSVTVASETPVHASAVALRRCQRPSSIAAFRHRSRIRCVVLLVSRQAPPLRGLEHADRHVTGPARLDHRPHAERLRTSNDLFNRADRLAGFRVHHAAALSLAALCRATALAAATPSFSRAFAHACPASWRFALSH